VSVLTLLLLKKVINVFIHLGRSSHLLPEIEYPADTVVNGAFDVHGTQRNLKYLLKLQPDVAAVPLRNVTANVQWLDGDNWRVAKHKR